MRFLCSLCLSFLICFFSLCVLLLCVFSRRFVFGPPSTVGEYNHRTIKLSTLYATTACLLKNVMPHVHFLNIWWTFDVSHSSSCCCLVKRLATSQYYLCTFSGSEFLLVECFFLVIGQFSIFKQREYLLMGCQVHSRDWLQSKISRLATKCNFKYVFPLWFSGKFDFVQQKR